MQHLVVQQYEVGRESLVGPMCNRRSANSSRYRPVSTGRISVLLVHIRKWITGEEEQSTYDWPL